MERITRCISIPVKRYDCHFHSTGHSRKLTVSMTVQIPEPDPMKLFHGVKFVLGQRASRSVHTISNIKRRADG
jgi:hypothetical protein